MEGDIIRRRVVSRTKEKPPSIPLCQRGRRGEMGNDQIHQTK